MESAKWMSLGGDKLVGRTMMTVLRDLGMCGIDEDDRTEKGASEKLSWRHPPTEMSEWSGVIVAVDWWWRPRLWRPWPSFRRLERDS